MTLLDRIRHDALAARKAKSPNAAVLTTLIGEAETAVKAMKHPRPLSDAEVVAIVRKFTNNIDATLEALRRAHAPEAQARVLAEKAALAPYLPAQMNTQEMEHFIRDAVAQGDDLGRIMARLKAEKAGQYDGKLAASLAKEALSA